MRCCPLEYLQAVERERMNTEKFYHEIFCDWWYSDKKSGEENFGDEGSFDEKSVNKYLKNE